MAEQIRAVGEFFACPIGQDVVILDHNGTCVASSDPQKMGHLPEINLQELDLTEFSTRPDVKLKIGFAQNSHYSPTEMELFRNLAKVTLDQFLHSISRPLVSIDQFITKLTEENINETNIAGLEDQASSFGLKLDVSRVAIVVHIDDFVNDHLSLSDPSYDREEIIKDWKNKITNAINGFFTIKTDIISAYTGEGNFVFFKETSGNFDKFVDYMKKAYLSIFGPILSTEKEKVAVGFSNVFTGIKGLHDSYKEALQALYLGRKFLRGKNISYFYGDLGTLRIITEQDPSKKSSCAKEILEPLDKETLRLTLEVFFNENMNIKKTAAKLKVHPNTVNYRLNKIAEDLGLDPRVFKQAFELRIALLTDKIFD